jgi:hypothetical protein
VPQFQKRYESLANKGWISAYPFLGWQKNSAKSVIMALLTVPFGTVSRSAGLRPGVVSDWNIEH